MTRLAVNTTSFLRSGLEGIPFFRPARNFWTRAGPPRRCRTRGPWSPRGPVHRRGRRSVPPGSVIRELAVRAVPQSSTEHGSESPKGIRLNSRGATSGSSARGPRSRPAAGVAGSRVAGGWAARPHHASALRRDRSNSTRCSVLCRVTPSALSAALSAAMMSSAERGSSGQVLWPSSAKWTV